MNPRLYKWWLVCLLTLLPAAAAWSEDWPQWRGPHRDGSLSSAAAPAAWPERLKLKWKLTVGEGHASPILAGGRIFVFTRQQGKEAASNIDPTTGNIVWQRTFANTSMKRGDILVDRASEAEVNPEPVDDEITRRLRDALARYQRAAEIFEKLSNQPDAGSAQFAKLFDVRIKIGDVLARQNKYSDALDAYQSALAAAAATQRVVDRQLKASDMIAQACDFLARRAGGGPAAAALAAGDEPDALSCYQKALAAIEAAAVKDPDNTEVKEKRAALSAKIAAQQPPAK